MEAIDHADSRGTGERLAQYDIAEGQPITGAVVDAVATADGTDPIELPPLYDSVDPDALDTLFERQREGIDLEITFSYAGYGIVVEDGDRVTVSATATPE